MVSAPAHTAPPAGAPLRWGGSHGHGGKPGRGRDLTGRAFIFSLVLRPRPACTSSAW